MARTTTFKITYSPDLVVEVHGTFLTLPQQPKITPTAIDVHDGNGDRYPVTKQGIARAVIRRDAASSREAETKIRAMMNPREKAPSKKSQPKKSQPQKRRNHDKPELHDCSEPIPSPPDSAPDQPVPDGHPDDHSETWLLRRMQRGDLMTGCKNRQVRVERDSQLLQGKLSGRWRCKPGSPNILEAEVNFGEGIKTFEPIKNILLPIKKKPEVTA